MRGNGSIFYRFASDFIETLKELPCDLPAAAEQVRIQLKKICAIAAPFDIVLYPFQNNGKKISPSNHALSDSAIVQNGDKFLVKRVPASLAKSILASADARDADERARTSEASSSKTSSCYDGLEALSDSDNENNPDAKQLEPAPFNCASSNATASSTSSVGGDPQSTSLAAQPDLANIEFDPNADFNEDEDEEENKREQLLMQEIISGQPANTARRSSGGVKPRETLASRYFRNSNMIWTKDSSGRPQQESSYVQPIRANTFGPRLFGGQRRQTTHPVIPVGEHYVCHICGKKGHHIKNCPLGSDPKRQKKVKPSRGFPRSWLQRISEDKVSQYEGEVYSLPGL